MQMEEGSRHCIFYFWHSLSLSLSLSFSLSIYLSSFSLWANDTVRATRIEVGTREHAH
jgi:hypothetical protein